MIQQLIDQHIETKLRTEIKNNLYNEVSLLNNAELKEALGDYNGTLGDLCTIGLDHNWKVTHAVIDTIFKKKLPRSQRDIEALIFKMLIVPLAEENKSDTPKNGEHEKLAFIFQEIENLKNSIEQKHRVFSKVSQQERARLNNVHNEFVSLIKTIQSQIDDIKTQSKTFDTKVAIRQINECISNIALVKEKVSKIEKALKPVKTRTTKR